jgi:hypothetical protein
MPQDSSEHRNFVKNITPCIIPTHTHVITLLYNGIRSTTLLLFGVLIMLLAIHKNKKLYTIISCYIDKNSLLTDFIFSYISSSFFPLSL